MGILLLSCFEKGVVSREGGLVMSSDGGESVAVVAEKNVRSVEDSYRQAVSKNRE